LDNIKKLFHSNRKEIKERKFISTGVYILDAALSAKMLGGISTNKLVHLQVSQGQVSLS
jgi:hypothetical protein